MKPLFVYGTLLENGAQAGLLQGCSRRPATLRGRLYRMPAGYPALVPGGSGEVHGELVELPRHALFGILDAYEGVEQGLYRREEHVARVGIRPVPCWAYVMHKPELRGGRVIPSGRWRSVRRR